jgi:hypothetical protein
MSSPASSSNDTARTLGERQRWLDKPANVERIVRALYAICGALFLADLFVPKHGPYAIEHRLGFYAIFGFVACVGLVLAAARLRRILMRDEDYYDR